jgi:methylphosphotriester-DNA--protein-cysteine methyltransferase
MDHSRVHQSFARIIGVSPSLYNTAHKLVEKIDYQNMTTALSITEQLYTARGSQSAG